MDEETLSRALEPFFTTKGLGKGTGLGLPMVHGLAQQSGGRFDLQSRLGRGTTAELWLPVSQEVPATGKPSMQSAAGVQRRGVPLVVLAVDDDNLVLTNTVAMLEDLWSHRHRCGIRKRGARYPSRRELDRSGHY